MSEYRALQRAQVLANHILCSSPPLSNTSLDSEVCLQYSPPELNESFGFDIKEMRKLLDGHNLEDRDWLYELMTQSNLFNRRERGGKIFVSPDYNQTMEQQREITMRRIWYLFERGVFEGWVTRTGPEADLKKLAVLEVCGIYDHAFAMKIGAHFFLWCNAVMFLGTRRHHEKWLKVTGDYAINGCFAMTELGHGSNVRGIETVSTYDPRTEEFVINTPCESAQKYWIGGAANHATHTIVFSQFNIKGTNQGVHAFIAQIRDNNGNISPNIRIADCGHKNGLNGIDNGRIWFDNLRVPRENLLNSVADVRPDGQYVSEIKDPDQRFAAFLASLTSGRVLIAANAIYSSKVGLAIAIRYSLSRRAFSIAGNGPEVLLLDYPSHQRRLLPLLAKTYALSFAANDLKLISVKRKPEANKAIHVVSSGLKAVCSWHNLQTLQECREACGGQGVKTENLVGHLKAEFDAQTTFEGDNTILMQQVSKALFNLYVSCKKRNTPFKGLGLEHMNSSHPVLPTQLTSSTLRCSQFQTNVFCLRERNLLERFTSEVAELQGMGESREFSFLQSHQLAEYLGRAFTEKSILQTILDAEAKLPTGSVKDILSLVRSMYSLICVEEDPSFLRYCYLSMDNVEDVRREVSKLCRELRPHALALVSSFGIPDSFLGPLAFNWVEANAWPSV